MPIPNVLVLPYATTHLELYSKHDVERLNCVERSEQGNLVPVRRCDKRREAEQYAFVLTATGVWSLMVRDGRFTTLYVTREDAVRANDELAAYDSENRKKPAESERPRPALPRIEVAMVYWAVLLFFFAAARNEAFSFNWVEEGAAQAGLMLSGEWWRAVTALCLHVNAAHLLGNLVFGTVFLLLLAQVTGAGVAWLSMVAAGAAGNVLSALMQSSAHTSIGASTAIFAGLGLLVALRQAHCRDRAHSTLRRWVPAAGGVALLVFLGLGGENTDILAHVLGFGSGFAGGWMLGKWNRDWPNDWHLQWKCVGMAGAMVATAWVMAVLV